MFQNFLQIFNINFDLQDITLGLKDYCHTIVSRGFVIVYSLSELSKIKNNVKKVLVCFRTSNSQAKISKDSQMIAFLFDGL